MTANEVLSQIDASLRAGRTDHALALLRELVADHPQVAEGRVQLGKLLLDMGQHEEAKTALSDAVRLLPEQALTWCLYAEALHRCGELEPAAAAYRRAIGLSPQFVHAYNNLGLVLAEQDRMEAAVKVFEAVLSIRPDYAAALNNLGSVLARTGQDAGASEAFAKAAKADPGSFEAWLNLGLARLRLGQVGESRSALQEALTLRPNGSAALLALASAWEREGKIEQASAVLQQGVAAGCEDSEVLLELARMLAEANDSEEARALYARVHRQRPSDLRAALGMHLTLPRVYGSRTEIQDARKAFSRGLEALEREVDALVLPPSPELLAQLSWVNFHLAYQGEDDRELQSRYGAWLAGVLGRGVPELMQERRRSPSHRIRVGFASSLFQRGTISSYFGSWVVNLDAERFEVFLYDAGETEDDTSRQLAAASANARRVPISARGGALSLAQAIAADELDVLIYPDLGMAPAMFPVAALRLAPVQCAAWGHPVTTGLPNIDYFFSCSDMEPENAQRQYSERLLVLPGLGTAYPRPAIPEAGSRQELGLPEGRNLYLFPHAPFKIHPDNDLVLADIAAADPHATFVLVQGRFPQVGEHLLERLAAALAARGIAAEGRFLVLPYLSHRDYLRLNLSCDVLVDCIHWSGGSTTLDALACGLPVVTLPGSTMRSRQGMALLWSVGTDELVAANRSELARIAVRVATDRKERNATAAQLLAQSHHLFGRTDFLPILQDFLEFIADKKYSGPPG